MDIWRDESIDLEQFQTLLDLGDFVILFEVFVLEGFFLELVLFLQLQVELNTMLIFH